MNQTTLWTKNFTLITWGSMASIIAGQVIHLPMSLMVFDQTGSALLSSILLIAGMLPASVLHY